MRDVAFAVFGIVALSLIAFGGFSDHDERAHQRCVDVRRVELAFNMNARKCPEINWWFEPNGHDDIDHE